jgi:hypothetical protein
MRPALPAHVGRMELADYVFTAVWFCMVGGVAGFVLALVVG